MNFVKVIRYFSFLICFQFLVLNGFSAVFTVVNNADSGTGSLRDMLTQAAANGNAEADVINFNLPDHTEVGRTILILSQLPLVSSNLTIDGSTQPGNVFGLSTSKVKILTGFGFTYIANVLLLEYLHDVEIYGLYIKNELICPSNQNCYFWQGIAVRDSKNIQIGAAGKGNVILGFQYDIGMNVTHGEYKYNNSSDITLKANFIGIEPDGITLSNVISKPVELFSVLGEVNIGGTPDEGNLFPNGFFIHQNNSVNYPGEIDSASAIIKFRNNKIGIDYSESVTFSSSGFRLGTSTPKGRNRVFIEDNIVSSSLNYGIFVINNLHEVNIRRNYIGTDRSLKKLFPMRDIGIFIYYSTNVKIGSNDNSDKNYIANCKPVDIWPYSSVSVNKNSFFCVRNMYPMILESTESFFYPVVKISVITGNSISGTATPNSDIELFYADACETCAPETYFASTTSDASGNWYYGGPIQGVVIASATFKGATSEFTKPQFDFTQLKIERTCPNYGSIKGIVPSNYIDITWVNESGAVVGTQPELLNVSAGRYKLIIGYGSCSAETPWYEVVNGLSINTSTMVITNASCSAANGSIKGVTTVNYTSFAVLYSWKDLEGNEVGTASELENIKPGKYLLNIKLADNSCDMSYGPIEVVNVSGPIINESSIVVSSSECGKAEGSIIGITTTGLGLLRYQWKNEDGEVVSSTQNLVNKPAGSYRLELFDESSCASIFSSIIKIPEINSVSLNDVGVVISNATCGESNGAISGIQAYGGTNYQWFNQLDQLIATTTDPNLNNIPEGNYYLIVVNSSCRKVSRIYTVGGNATIINNDHVQIKNDECNLNLGSITGIQVSGKIPFNFRWENDSGTLLGNQKDLKNATKGIYHLIVTDVEGCSVVSTYQLFNQSKLSQPPNLNDLKLCGSGDAILVVNNAEIGYGYKLYDDDHSLIPLDVQQSGRFKINVKENRSFYISQYSGDCESPRGKIEVRVGFSALRIPNTFTPNNDGNNDYWVINGIENYLKISISVFNRYGTVVFESNNYQVIFDGNMNGKQLPVGVYYYIIKIGEGCSPFSGSLTLLR